MKCESKNQTGNALVDIDVLYYNVCVLKEKNRPQISWQQDAYLTSN